MRKRDPELGIYIGTNCPQVAYQARTRFAWWHRKIRIWQYDTRKSQLHQLQYGITETTEYLERFFRNLLMGEQNELKSVSTQESTQKANKSLIEATQKDNFTTQKTFNTTQKKILNYLKEHPNATRKDMSAVIGDITEDDIKFNIGKLQQYGRLKREGGRKSGTWVVIDNDVFSWNISVSS